MTLTEQWLRRPQNVWLRRALFQVHLWTGIAAGLYVFIVCVTGSAIVFRDEIFGKAGTKPAVTPVGEKLDGQQIRDAARKALPGYTIRFVFEGRRPTDTTEIWLERGGTEKHRLFNPYTGQDLGDAAPKIIVVVAWLADLHTNLLYGRTGREVNGWASGFLVLLCITGAVIWWPGAASWKRAMTVLWSANWKRLNFDLHSAIGFWTFAFVLMWGVTGVYVCFPAPFQRMIHKVAPLNVYRPPEAVAEAAPAAAFVDAQPDRPRQRRPLIPPNYSFGDKIVRWATYLHFGNFAGSKTKALWVVLGLSPVFLFVTGLIMWWNRVLSREARRAKRRATERVPSAA